MKFFPQEFFDLSTFSEKNLFTDDVVWSALLSIDDYLKNIKGYRELSEGVFVGENVIIDETAKIEERCIIGSNSTIGHGAYVRGGVILGENVRIGHAVEIKHSIVLNNSSMAHLTYVGDSIVGNNVKVGGGAIFANKRMDGENVKIKTSEKVFDTSMRKMGAIVGDNSFIGANAVLNPGTILGKECRVFPLTSARGVHPSDSVIS